MRGVRIGPGQRSRLSVLILTIWTGASIACGNESTPTGPSDSLLFSIFATSRVTFRYTALDAANIQSTAAALDVHHRRITADLGVQQMPPVTVTLYPNRESLRAAVGPLLGSIPTFANGLVTGPDAIHIVSPSLSSEWAYQTGITGIVHEFAHCVTLRVSPALPANARWLWESVALFEARQFVDPRTVPSLADGQPPPLRQLNALDDRTVYDVGGLLGEFIVDTWGRDTLISLVRADGNILEILGIAESEFLARWMTYLRGRFAM
jgi:hypothetical protein